MATREMQPTNASIRKGDQVRVMKGRSKGKTGRVLFVDPKKRTVTVEQANIIKRHTREPATEYQGRNCGQGRPDPDFERAAALSGMQQAHARWAQCAAGRHESARLPALRHDAREIGSGDQLDDEPIATTLPQRGHSRADEALRIQE